MALFKDENDEDGDSADDSVSASAPETVKSILSEPASASETVKSTLSESTSASETAKSILAVDDDVYCIDMFKAALQSIPCKIIGATSGKSALNILKMRTPDLFVLDIEMPEMNGYQLARELRANGQKSPIVFITGNSTNDCISQALKVGAADFIVKPINPGLVLARIGKFL
jgi:PleD family two-component response regulator